MSVTFKLIGAKETFREEECLCVHPDEGPDEDCAFCSGTGTEKVLHIEHSHNFANSNAAAVLGAAGLDSDDLYGSLSLAEIANVRQRVLRALNSERSRASHLREPVEIAGGKREDGVVELRPQPNFFAMGLDDNGLVRRLQMFYELCEVAQEQQTGICWS